MAVETRGRGAGRWFSWRRNNLWRRQTGVLTVRVGLDPRELAVLQASLESTDAIRDRTVSRTTMYHKVQVKSE